MRRLVVGLAAATLFAACSGDGAADLSTAPESTTTPDTVEVTGNGPAPTSPTMPPVLTTVAEELECDTVKVFSGLTGPIRSAVVQTGFECDRNGDRIHVFLRNPSPPEVWADQPLAPFGVDDGLAGGETCRDWLLVSDRLVLAVAGPEVAERTKSDLSESFDVVEPNTTPASYGLPSGCSGGNGFGDE